MCVCCMCMRASLSRALSLFLALSHAHALFRSVNAKTHVAHTYTRMRIPTTHPVSYPPKPNPQPSNQGGMPSHMLCSFTSPHIHTTLTLLHMPTALTFPHAGRHTGANARHTVHRAQKRGSLLVALTPRAASAPRASAGVQKKDVECGSKGGKLECVVEIRGLLLCLRSLLAPRSLPAKCRFRV
jgi:hypothetical protein